MSCLRRSSLALALAGGLCSVLAACGGGGSGPDPIDPFLVTFVGYCHAEPLVTNSATGAVLYGYTVQSAVSKAGPNLAMMQDTEYFFAASDCSGPVQTSLVVSGPNTWLRIDGSEQVQGVWPDLVTVSEDDKLPNAAAGVSVSTSDGVTYAAAFLVPTTSKDLYYLNDYYLYDGDFTQPLDANGYPTALGTSPLAEVQQ